MGKFSSFGKFLSWLLHDEQTEYKPEPNEETTIEVEDIKEVVPQLSECRELVVYTTPMHENMANRAHLNTLEEQIKIFEDAMKELNDEFDTMNRELHLTHYIGVARLKELKEELQMLFEERIRQQNGGEEPKLFDGDEDLTVEDEEELDRLEAELDETNRAERRAEVKRKKEHAKQMKKLIRKITLRTHPDRTDDPRLHAFFDAAVKAYQEQDYETLMMISTEINLTGSTLWQALRERIDHLKSKLKNAQMEYVGLKDSDDFKMLLDFKNPARRMKVERHFQQMIDMNIRKTIEAIQSIDSERHRPPKAESHDGFKTHTKTVMSEANDNELETPWADEQ